MLGFAASLMPSVGYSRFATVIPLVLGALFQNVGIDVDLESIVGSAPCQEKLMKYVTEDAMDTMLLTQDSVQRNSHVYFSSGKGNKKGNKHLAKFICWCDVEEK